MCEFTKGELVLGLIAIAFAGFLVVSIPVAAIWWLIAHVRFV